MLEDVQDGMDTVGKTLRLSRWSYDSHLPPKQVFLCFHRDFIEFDEAHSLPVLTGVCVVPK